ncbi:unnamed protein product [Vicia faba]|uniref:F-box associated beta-propeller type 1 domain-containing protein n=1 Tax=Vicia faba TaxID=3906 RepID=A0AAV0ZCQ4_VICFA|nr:unnamed protein product [Vicia faba]
MEKISMAATKKKVSKYVPDDIVFMILSKLPIKSLKRFECVRKSWSLLIENTSFMNMFHNNLLSNLYYCSYYDQASLFMLVHGLTRKDYFYSFSIEKFESKVKLDLSNPFEDQEDYLENICIFGFSNINGTFFLYQDGSCKIVILWNPSRDEFNHIPPSPIESTLSRDARYSSPPDVYVDPIWEIYSLKSNSWRKLDLNMPHSIMGTKDARLYMDGMCHWLCRHRSSPFTPCLTSFYLSKEEFFVTSIPDDCFVVGEKEVYLAMLNEFIALLDMMEMVFTYQYWVNSVEKNRGFCSSLLGHCLAFHLGYEEEACSFPSRVIVYKESILPIEGISS